MEQTVKWWKNAVIYQIYPRSFQDSDGDGVGDLNGIVQRLDYLAGLGVDALWLCPVYRSPQDDNGYDISDYCDIDPLFGTLADMERLIREAARRGIRIIMDLVLNHSSDEHPWFLEAKKSRENPYHDYYIWRDGVPGTPPNDMKACFGGSAWTWVPELGQYYFHQFSVKQPDLNWDNPAVRRQIYEVINFWIEKGVGGFRLDVIDQIAKVPDEKITNNGPMLHAYIREMNRATFGGTDLVTVGETWGATPEIARRYSDPAGDEFSMVFQFEHIGLDQQPGGEKWDLAPLCLTELKRVFSKWQTELYGRGWNSLFWNNHDLPRIVSRWGDDGAYREVSAKMLATLLYGLQGTPYIYQGEELGMTNACFPLEDCRDIETLNFYKERREKGYAEEEVMRSIHAKGRDNARTPMQWTDGPNAGFTTGSPWIRVNPNYRQINAEQQIGEPGSVYSYYKRLIALRKETPVVQNGRYELLCPEDTSIFAYKRDDGANTLYVVCNFYGRPAEGPLLPVREGQVLISNYPEPPAGRRLRPYEAVWYLCRNDRADPAPSGQ
ncbi:MAG TPA: alpha-glucosidase [Candidatus Fournierella pullicola]|uniref:Alpha-glucosidase n=1 Tax=Candidatus Allofournierella pullicola TaxID=2838596 RepID=A0A9D1V4L5_9FIRM|nr:alpha-glucosidase [Candidatus Fournierella pullicola]